MFFKILNFIKDVFITAKSINWPTWTITVYTLMGSLCVISALTFSFFLVDTGIKMSLQWIIDTIGGWI